MLLGHSLTFPIKNKGYSKYVGFFIVGFEEQPWLLWDYRGKFKKKCQAEKGMRGVAIG